MTDLETKIEYCIRYVKLKLFSSHYKGSYRIMADV